MKRAGSRLPARLASPALLAKQDLCILVNVSLQAKLGRPVEPLPAASRAVSVAGSSHANMPPPRLCKTSPASAAR